MTTTGPFYSDAEIQQIIAQATEAIERATQELNDLRRQLADKDALISSIQAERDHWYTTAIGGQS